jgi:hypothetical protein
MRILDPLGKALQIKQSTDSNHIFPSLEAPIDWDKNKFSLIFVIFFCYILFNVTPDDGICRNIYIYWVLSLYPYTYWLLPIKFGVQESYQVNILNRKLKSSRELYQSQCCIISTPGLQKLRYLRKVKGKTRKDRIRIFRKIYQIKSVTEFIYLNQKPCFRHMTRMKKERFLKQAYGTKPQGIKSSLHERAVTRNQALNPRKNQSDWRFIQKGHD